jgi:hypothetical protein
VSARKVGVGRCRGIADAGLTPLILKVTEFRKYYHGCRPTSRGCQCGRPSESLPVPVRGPWTRSPRKAGVGRRRGIADAGLLYSLVPGRGVTRTPFFHFSNCCVATFSEGGGPRSGSADSGSDPACGLARLYLLRLPTQARPRDLSPSPSAGTRIPQVAGATRPARLPAQKLQASAALSIYIGLAHFPSFPRRLPRALQIWSPGEFLGACRSCGQKIAHILADIAGWDLLSQASSRNFVDPLPATRAVGRCEATDAIPTGTRRRRRIPHRSDRVSPRLCVRTAFASARLCRSLLSFAFHLARPVI